jgi:hypothetical protein
MEQVFDKVAISPTMIRKLARRVPVECTLQEFIQLQQAELEQVFPLTVPSFIPVFPSFPEAFKSLNSPPLLQ